MDHAEQQRELLRAQRWAIKESLAEYYRVVPLGAPPIANREPLPHHLLCIDALQRLERREISRLLILMPFNSGKTTLCTRLFPAWFLARHPYARVGIIAHTENFAIRWSRQLQGDVVNQGRLLGLKLSGKVTALTEWELTSGGSVLAVGAQGALSGARFDLICCDDPIATVEAARSATEREKLSRWWFITVASRLETDDRGTAPIVVVATPYDQSDLLAEIQAQNNNPEAEQWTILRLPAISEGIGDPLGRAEGVYLGDGWNDPRNYGQWLRKRQIDLIKKPLEWSACYQLKPSPETGTFFQREWFGFYEKAPPRDKLSVYMASDFAVTEGAGDYTVHLICGFDPTGQLYALDIWRQQTETDVWVEAAVDLVKKWRPTAWGLETGQLRGGLLPWIKRRFRERGVALPWRQEFGTKGGKGVRAQSIRGKLGADSDEAEGKFGILLPESKNPVWGACLSECMQFTGARNARGHDDFVDCLGLIGQMLDKVILKLPEEVRNPSHPMPKPGELVLPDILNEYHPRKKYGEIKRI